MASQGGAGVTVAANFFAFLGAEGFGAPGVGFFTPRVNMTFDFGFGKFYGMRKCIGF